MDSYERSPILTAPEPPGESRSAASASGWATGPEGTTLGRARGGLDGDSPVQTFVPLITENKARNKLQERAHDQGSGEE